MSEQTRDIKNMTLKIKEAEIVESQLTPDDLAALAPAPVRCGGTYCKSSYSDAVALAEA